MPKFFNNPYSGIEKTQDYKRIAVNVPTTVHNFLWQIRAGHGTINGTINTLIDKLVTALKERGINDLTSVKAFEDFVANSELLLPGESPTTVEKPKKTKKQLEAA